MWFPNRSDTNRPVQPQKQARSLKLWGYVEEELYYPSNENKGADQLRGTAKLICVFVFVYADCWVSHEVAHTFIVYIKLTREKVRLLNNKVQIIIVRIKHNVYCKFGNVFVNLFPREFKVQANKESIGHKDYKQLVNKSKIVKTRNKSHVKNSEFTVFQMSRGTRKPDFCLYENKSVDHSNCEAGQHLCFRYMDSTISLLLKSKILSF